MVTMMMTVMSHETYPSPQLSRLSLQGKVNRIPVCMSGRFTYSVEWQVTLRNSEMGFL